MLSYAEVTKRCAIESLIYKALHASGATGAVRLSVFVACGLASEMCGPVAQAYAFRVCARAVHVKYGCARSARKFWRILANFGRIIYNFQELCRNFVGTLHEFRGILCELL